MAPSCLLNAQGKCEFEMHKVVEDHKLFSFYHFQTFASSIIYFRYPYIFWNMTTTDQGFLAIFCTLLLKIEMYYKTYKVPC